MLRLVVLFVALLCGCSKKEPSSPSHQILRLSQRNEPADLDPAIATLPDEFAILRAFSEGLLIPGPNGTEPRPGVAERFEVSSDRLTYTFHLRPNATWSNGEPVTAHDFVASYRRVLTPTTAAPKASVFFPVKNARSFLRGELTDFSAVGIRAADTYTLVVTLAEPNPRFPHYAASGPWIPVHGPTVTKHGRKWTRPENFVGNGPFVLAEWQPHQRILARRNSRWHGASSVRLDEIHFLHFDNGDAEERAYRAGQIDATMAVPNSKLETYQRERPNEVHHAAMHETRYLSLNTRRPPLNDERVRRALSLAIDRQALVDHVTRGKQPAAKRFIPPGLLGRNDTASNPTPDEIAHRHDPAAARRLLAAAGIDPIRFPRLELTAWSPSQVPVLEAIQAMWTTHLGITVAIAIRDAKVHLDALQNGSYDIGFIFAIPDVADAANLLGDFASNAPENYPQWSDAVFDSNLVALGKLPDPTARNATFAELENRLLTAAPVAPLYHNTKIWLMSPRVRGWQEDGLWSRTYHQLSIAPP